MYFQIFSRLHQVEGAAAWGAAALTNQWFQRFDDTNMHRPHDVLRGFI